MIFATSNAARKMRKRTRQGTTTRKKMTTTMTMTRRKTTKGETERLARTN